MCSRIVSFQAQFSGWKFVATLVTFHVLMKTWLAWPELVTTDITNFKCYQPSCPKLLHAKLNHPPHTLLLLI